MIEGRAQEAGVYDNGGHEECVPHEGEGVAVERDHGQEQRRVADAGVGLEDGKDAEQEGEDRERLATDADGQTTHVSREV